MKARHLFMALLAVLALSCRKSDDFSEIPDDTKEPTDTVEVTPPEPAKDTVKTRWDDTGADLPDYPTYNKVSKLADFPRVDITWDSNPNKYRLAEGEFEYVNGTIKFSDPAGMYTPEENVEFDFDNTKALTMKIRCRGNTSWNAEGNIKNSYRIKLMDDTCSAKEPHRLFGMKKDSDWYLLGDIQDPTLLRNAVALRIARMVSMPWTPKYRCVEVYQNNTYLGCYLLCEAKEADRDSKAPITVIEPGQAPDAGGYLLEIDNKGDYDRYFRTETFEKKIKFKEPDFGDKNNPDNSASAQAQMEYIMDYVNEVEELLNDRNFDPETGYRSKMEVGTFIGNYIVHELMKNMDGGMRLSTYFAKDSDTKLFMPFVWDFDLTLGNYNENPSNSFNLSDGNTPQGWFIRLRGGSFETPQWNPDVSDPYGVNKYGAKTSYYQCLFEDPQFVEDLKEYWTRVKPRLDKIPTFIDKMVEYNTLAYDHNSSAGKNPRANNKSENWSAPKFSSWSAAVSDMKSWYTQRLSWLDTNIKSLKAQHYNESKMKYE